MVFNEDKVYSLSELAAVLKESTSESKPKIDSKVIRDDAQNNVKAVKDIMKETEKVTKGLESEKRDTNPELARDLNRTTLDNHFAYEPDDTYKERVKAQVHGFPSVENEKNSSAKDNESLDYEGNKEFYDSDKEKMKELDDKETELKHSGLASHNLPKDNFKNKTGFTESKKMKRLRFSHTVFLSEAQMLKKIPEEYKTDNNRFIMADSAGTEYLVECKKDENFDGFMHVNVLNRVNKKELDEQFKRMRELTAYKSSDFNTGSTRQSRLNEDAKVKGMLDTVKSLNEKLNR